MGAEIVAGRWSLRQAMRSRRLGEAGIEAIESYERTGRPELLDAAVSAFQESVDASPSDAPDTRRHRFNLGLSMRMRFERVGDVADLDAAIRAGQSALDVTPVGNPDRGMYLSFMGYSLSMRFERVGDVADLDAAILAGRGAVEATPYEHPDRAGRLSNLGLWLSNRFERLGDVADLDAAIWVKQESVEATPYEDPHRAGRLSNFGVSLLRRFERAGDIDDLDAAIRVGREAVDATPAGSPDRAGRLSNFGRLLTTRFEWAGDVDDLDAGIRAGREAVDATPRDDPDRARYLSNLGLALLRRFERAGEIGDLDAAIQAGQASVDATPVDSPDRAACLSNLGLSLRRRWERTRDDGDLDAAFQAGREAVEAVPVGHSNRIMYLSNLGLTLLRRFESAGDIGDLDAAIHVAREAVEATPAQHPNRTVCLSNLGTFLRLRFARAGDSADLDDAITCWRQGSEIESGPPSMRLTAASDWGNAAAGAGRMRDAADGFEAAVGLLPAVAWHGLDRSTRQEQLAQWAGLAGDAAACAVLDGRPRLAVELLEQGRSVLWAQALDLRTDLTRLTEAAPDLAARLSEIRTVLDTAAPETSATRSGPETVSDIDRRYEDEQDRRRELAREWDQVLDQVRGLDGFEHFLAPTPYAELAGAAADGPVVVVNTSAYGCHALIVEAGSEQPRVVDLPDLTMDGTVEREDALLQALAMAEEHGSSFLERERDRHTVLDVLDWLWDVIGEPVLTALGHTSAPPPGERWPQVWWCPTGALTMLPIHAAGHHPRANTSAEDRGHEGAGVSVLDRVVSSYTPTLAALARARESGSSGDPVEQLTVALPTTPDLPPLPAATQELDILAQCFPPSEANIELVGPDATREAVLDAIATHPWVHLACHAGQNQDDPSRSGFELWDGPLTIAHLEAKPTTHRDLAFLSACETATGSVRHQDEAIHLAAAMQFLGYRHVIATMWSISDSLAPEVAGAVYAELTGGGAPSADHTAHALHQAVLALRASDSTNPIRWAPYTHLGA